MTEKPGFLSYDRKTALLSDVIVIRRQVLIEGTVRFTFPRRDRTSVSRWTSEPREGLVVDRAKVVTLFPSYDKTTLSIGLVPGFEPATYRSYATKLTPPVDSAVEKYGFLSARCLLVTFGEHLWFMTEKTTCTYFFAHKALHFFFNERLLDSSSCNFGLRLTTEYFLERGRGGGGEVIVCHRLACFDDGAR